MSGDGAAGATAKESTMRYVWMVVGVLAVLAGLVWTLQGLNIMGGSAMSGNSTWAIVGPIVFVIGMLVFLFALRRRDRQT
jgi:cytochrome bd-type quinol oxidase subunit 2